MVFAVPLGASFFVPVMRLDHFNVVIFEEASWIPEDCQKILTPSEKLLDTPQAHCPGSPFPSLYVALRKSGGSYDQRYLLRAAAVSFSTAACAMVKSMSTSGLEV